MKILIVSDAWLPQVNGVVRTYEHLRDELTKLNCNVDIIGPHDFKFKIPMPGYNEIDLVIFPYLNLKKKIEGFKPESIHIATEGPLGWSTRRYCIRYNIPFTTAYHTQFPDYVKKRVAKFCPPLCKFSKYVSTLLIKKFHSKAFAIMVASPSLEQELLGLGYKTPMHPLTRGAHIDIFYPGDKDVYQDLPHPIALYVGRVAIEKNLEDFLSMDWHGSKVIVGDGPDFEMLKQNYPDTYFAGSKTGHELASHYRSADVFVFPSRTDTFGIVLLEALASGLPIAAYNVTGPKDIITKPHLGVLHESLSHAATLALQIKGEGKDRQMHVKNHYTWEKAAQQFLDIQTLAKTNAFNK